MATIYDVAKHAGVSPSTVSRAFKNPERIGAAVRERVFEVARELGYEPKVSDRPPAGKRVLVIALVIPDIQNPFSATLARGVQERLSSEGHVCLICTTNGDPAAEVRGLREVYCRGVDGLIVTPPQLQVSPRTNDYIRWLLGKGVPMAFVGNRLDDPHVDSVTCRAQDGAVKAINYLVSLGHKDIGFIGGHYTEGVAVGRWLGYQEALIDNRLPIRPEYMLEGELSRSSGEAAMYRLLDLPSPPTAVLAVNDLMAIGAMDACHTRGVRVPDQLSIIGFDNIAMAELITPPLTTVSQPALEMGVRAAELLLRRSADPKVSPQQILLRCTLVVRATTAPPIGLAATAESPSLLTAN